MARLARFPEGLALLRMRSDLDAAERLRVRAQVARLRSRPGGTLALVRGAMWIPWPVHGRRRAEVPRYGQRAARGARRATGA